MDFDEKQVIGRIQQLRIRHFGVRGKSTFAKKLGLSASTYNYYEDDRLAPISVLLKISEITGADLYWILKGENAPEQCSHTPSAKESAAVSKIARFAQDNPQAIDAVLSFIDLLEQTEAIKNNQNKNARHDEDWIPVLGRTAAGIIGLWKDTTLPEPGKAVSEISSLVEKYIGKTIEKNGNQTIDVNIPDNYFFRNMDHTKIKLIQVNQPDISEVSEFLECKQLKEVFPDCFALRIDGDSMQPRINDSELIVLSPSMPARQGQIAVAKIHGQIGVTCKIIRSSQGEVHLIPINEKYETKIVPEKEVLWALAVLCHIKTLGSP